MFFRHILTYQAGTVSQNQKLEVIVQCLTWLVQFLGKKLIFTSKVWHIHPTSSPCCTARIATKLFSVLCHIINIKTLKYHFPTVCTWGVMQLLVNPIWSTILGQRIPVKNRYSAVPNLKMYMIQESDRSMQMWLYEYHYTVIIFRPDFRLEMPPRIIVVRRKVGFSTSRRMTDMDPPVPCFAIVEGYGPLWFDPKLSEICVREKIQSYGGKQPKKQVS